MSDNHSNPEVENCFACGGAFPKRAGPTHKYMLSTAGCWSAFGELLAREYESPVLFGAVHRLTVDAYSLQHPGESADPRARQSIWIHYAALYMALEIGRPLGTIPAVMQKLAGKSFPPLPLAPRSFELTHADVLARPIGEHSAAVRQWAHCAYDAWQALRQPTRDMLETL